MSSNQLKPKQNNKYPSPSGGIKFLPLEISLTSLNSAGQQQQPQKQTKKSLSHTHTHTMVTTGKRVRRSVLCSRWNQHYA